jgi:hypothetical protein
VRTLAFIFWIVAVTEPLFTGVKLLSMQTLVVVAFAILMELFHIGDELHKQSESMADYRIVKGLIEEIEEASEDESTDGDK